MFRWLRTVDRCLLDLFYPQRTICLGCGRLSRGEWMCDACAEEMQGLRIGEPICRRCGHPVKEGRACRFCHGRLPVILRSAWRHKDPARKLVSRLKYEAEAACVQPLARGVAEMIRSLEPSPDTLVTWVTMPDRRRRQRGIDHGCLLAQEAAKLCGLNCRRLLIRRDDRHTQRGLGRAERMQNLWGAFACEEELTGPVILVDDVVTTSATAQLCAACLYAAGAAQVMVVTATMAE